LQSTDKIEQLTRPVLDDLGFELVDLEYQREQRGWVLRFFLDKEGGITLDDCAVASREISTLLDVEDIIDTAYNLEVSSPGLERPLKRLADFERFVDQLIKIKTHTLIDPDQSGKPRKTFTGYLLGVDQNDVLLKTDGKRSVDIRIAYDLIEKANLKFEF